MQSLKLTALRRGAAAILLASSLVISPAHSLVLSQDNAPDNVGTAASSSTVIYDSEYFAPFGPVTLEDMIRNIPGGSSLLNTLRRNSGNRGFGSDGPPLLIDGRRMTGKSNDIVTRLARIPASQVERIELIRGNAEGLDIRSDGVIYNVILRQDASNSSSNFIDIGAKYARGAKLGPQLLLSHSGRKGELEYGISYQFENDPRVTIVREDVLSPARAPLQFRDLTRKNVERDHTATANVGYEFANGAQVRLNGLYTDYLRLDSRNEDQFLVGAGGTLNFFAVEDALFRYASTEWELGGDFEMGVGPLGTLKTLFVITRRANDNDLVQDIMENGIRTPIFSQVADFDEDETIFRASLNTPLSGKHSLEYGAEAAFNSLNTVFAFNNGPVESAVVTEDRYEAFITHSFKISNKLNLQTGVTGEFSTITQNRDGVSNARDFSFIKPRIELRYDLSTNDQFRLFAERTASQLDLNDFVASRNIDDDLINFGNPDLSPESTWRYSVGYERRFNNDAGSLQVEVYYESISDLIDKILIGAASSGIGNIGDARIFGVDTELNTRFGFVGLPNAVLTLRYNYKNSQATDPFTGETRLIKRRTPHFWSFDFRHDIGGSKFAYGFSGHRRSLLQRQDVSLRETINFKRHVEAYGEYNLSPKMKLRFTAHRFLGDARTADKTFYVGNIADDIVDRIERQDTSIKTEYEIRFLGTF